MSIATPIRILMRESGDTHVFPVTREIHHATDKIFKNTSSRPKYSLTIVSAVQAMNVLFWMQTEAVTKRATVPLTTSATTSGTGVQAIWGLLHANLPGNPPCKYPRRGGNVPIGIT